MKKFLTSLITISLLIGLTSCGPKPPKTFTVTYESEIGTAPEAITVDEGTILAAEQLPTLTDASNSFLGWFDGETEAKADEYTVTKDVTLTAKWTKTVYTVSFETEFGTAPEAIKAESGTILTAEQLPALTDANNNFLGWFDGETQAKATEYKVTKNVTLKAKWEPKVFWTVTYVTKYGTAPKAIKVEDGTTLSAEQLKALSVQDYIFQGWFDGDKEAKATEYKVTKNITLTAKWNLILWTGSKDISWNSALEIADWKDKLGDYNALKVTYTTTDTKPMVRFMDKTNWKNNFPEYSEGDCELIRKIDEGTEINDIDLPVNKENGVVTLAFTKDQMATLAENGAKIQGEPYTVTKIELTKVSYTLAPEVVLWEGEETIKYEDNIVIPAGKIPADAKGLRIYVKSCTQYQSSICFDYPDWKNRPHMSSITGNADGYNEDEMAILNVENGPAIVNCYFTSDVMTSFSSQAIGVHGDANANTVITKITLIK